MQKLKLITVSQAAKSLGVKRQRMHKIIHSYKIPVVRLGSGLLLVDPADIERRVPPKRPRGVNKKYLKKHLAAIDSGK